MTITRKDIIIKIESMFEKYENDCKTQNQRCFAIKSVINEIKSMDPILMDRLLTEKVYSKLLYEQYFSADLPQRFIKALNKTPVIGGMIANSRIKDFCLSKPLSGTHDKIWLRKCINAQGWHGMSNPRTDPNSAEQHFCAEFNSNIKHLMMLARRLTTGDSRMALDVSARAEYKPNIVISAFVQTDDTVQIEAKYNGNNKTSYLIMMAVEDQLTCMLSSMDCVEKFSRIKFNSDIVKFNIILDKDYILPKIKKSETPTNVKANPAISLYPAAVKKINPLIDYIEQLKDDMKKNKETRDQLVDSVNQLSDDYNKMSFKLKKLEDVLEFLE